MPEFPLYAELRQKSDIMWVMGPAIGHNTFLVGMVQEKEESHIF